jgi:AcrR family transcriptional regulator
MVVCVDGTRATSRGLTREAWEDAALDAIAERGLSALAIEPLARKLGVTKGSFYWHFESREALLEAALARWEQRSTDELIERVRGLESPREALATLAHIAIEEPLLGRLELVLGAAGDHGVVGPVIRRVMKRRLELLTQLFRGLGCAPSAARRRALLAYAAYAGLYHVMRADPALRGQMGGPLVIEWVEVLSGGMEEE